MLKPTRLLRRLARQQQHVLAALQARTPQQLSTRPSDSGWSALEVLSHLIKVDQGMLGDIITNLQQPATPMAPAARLRSSAVTLLMWLPVRVPMPPTQAARITPETSGDLTVLSLRWREVRAGFDTIDYAAANAGARAFFHAVGGSYTIPGALSLLLAHTHHHRYQLRRIAATSPSLRRVPTNGS